MGVCFRVTVVSCLSAILFAASGRAAQDTPAANAAAWDSLNTQAKWLSEQSAYEEAAEVARKALTAAEAAFGSNHPNTAAVLNTLGEIYRKQARYAEAESLIVRSLQTREKALGSDHADVAASLHNLATLYFVRGQYEKAEPLHKRALAVREKALGADHRDVAESLNNLANLYKAQGRYDEAESLYKRALQIREKVLGPDHYLVGFSLDNLALLYKSQGRYDDAEPLHVQALAIEEKVLGPEHRDVAFTLNNLAILYYRQGRYDDAEPLHKRALAIKEKILGPDHPTVASSLNNLSQLYRAQARYAEAEPLSVRALAIKEKALGANHPSVAVSLSILAGLYRYQGRYDDAGSLYRRALNIREKALGPDHPDVASSLSSLALMYRIQTRFTEAEHLHRRALNIREKALGPDHTDVAASLRSLAGLYSFQGRHVEADSLYKRALSIVEKALGPDHPSVAVSLSNLAGLYKYQGRHGEAESLNRRALGIRETKLGADHPSVAGSLSRLANLYRSQGKYAEAESLYERALEIRTGAFGPDHPYVAGSLKNLAEVYVDQGRYAEAAPLLDRAFPVLEAVTAYSGMQVGAYDLRSRVRKAEGDVSGALADLAEAVLLVEEMRPQMGGGEETRAFFFGLYANLFDRMVAWLVEDGQVGEAFEYAERGRGRILLDQLAAGKIDLRRSIPPDILAPLEARESGAMSRLAEYGQRIRLMQGRADLSEAERAGRIAALEDSLTKAEADYRQVYEEIKSASFLWRDLITSGGRPIDLRTAQRHLMSAGRLMLLYQLGSEESYLFVIPPAGETPSVVRLEVAGKNGKSLGLQPGALKADSLRAVLVGRDSTDAPDGLILYLNRRPGGKAPGRARGLVLSGGDPSDAATKLHALWQVLVPEVVWSRLAACREVVIVPDGELNLLPFEALVVAVDGTGEGHRYWLDDGPTIRYAPSATVLYNIARRPSPRTMPLADRATVLSLSDPIFDPVQVILASGAGASDSLLALDIPSGSQDVAWVRAQDIYTRAGGSLDRLPGTARETEAIARAFGSQGVQELTRLNASEMELRHALAGKRYLHLGTHGLVNVCRAGAYAADSGTS